MCVLVDLKSVSMALIARNIQKGGMEREKRGFYKYTKLKAKSLRMRSLDVQKTCLLELNKKNSAKP